MYFVAVYTMKVYSYVNITIFRVPDRFYHIGPYFYVKFPLFTCKGIPLAFTISGMHLTKQQYCLLYDSDVFRTRTQYLPGACGFVTNNGNATV